MRRVDFWYEFASTYSHPAAARIEELADTHGVTISWQPFLLGPILKQLGWSTSPFNLQHAKGRYMWHDVARTCQLMGLPPLKRPVPFPQNSLLAARVALAIPDDSRRAQFSRSVFCAEFAEASNIDDPNVIAGILDRLGIPSADLLERAGGSETKDLLRAQVARAEKLGIFGAPTFVTSDEELFWGNDRLEGAVRWETNNCK
ncbi:MAG: 2-hydroxychromene-2-carboxylate isomerase [Filomicrobium sp.]